jgi:molybdenum cofactor synthesis domain-containing protein
MQPFTRTISLDEARAIMADAVRPIDRIERLALSDANGRVLAQPIVSSADVPPFSRAAMDGYAVRAADTAGASRERPATLRCIGQVFTGQAPDHPVDAGECLEIATGAPMPEGADAVVMVEETRADGSTVHVLASAQPGQNIGRQGSDIRVGQAVIAAGTALNASRIGALAALGTTRVDVYARPRVAILSTGNEIVDPGVPLRAGHIYDINRFTLSAVVSDHGGIPVPLRTAADTIDDLSRAIDECSAEDLIVCSGGSSVGRRDLMMDVISARGEILFHGIAIKPGKPTAFGRIDGKPVFGMPGYPTSCLSNAYILLAPTLRQIARLPAQTSRSLTLPLGARVNSVAGRLQFYPVRITDGAALPAFKASGDITSMSQADGYIEIPAATEVLEKGEVVEVKLF